MSRKLLMTSWDRLN